MIKKILPLPSIKRRLILCYVLSACFITLAAVLSVHMSLMHFTRRLNSDFIKDGFRTVFNILDNSSDKTKMLSNLELTVIKEPLLRGQYRYFVRILDEQGRRLLQSPTMEYIASASVFPKPYTDDYFSEPKAIVSNDNRHYFLMSSYYFHHGQRWLIQIALDSTLSAGCTSSYFRFVWMFLGIVIAFVVLIGFYVTQTGLKPLERLNHSLDDLSVSQLETRLVLADWPLELQPIATGLNAMLDRINSSSSQLKHFSSDLAHELRTPLNSMICQVEVCLNKEREKDEYRDVLDSLLEEFQKTSKMVDDMLFIARANDINYQLSYQPLELAKLLTGLKDYLQLLADEKQIRLEVRGHASLQANAALLKRALSNLISNSIRYSANNTLISVEVSEQDAMVCITVADQGIGIALADIPHIFERFYRVEASRTQATGGTGIGLAIVKSIVDLHHGRIEVDSAPGVGTRMRVLLPKRQ